MKIWINTVQGGIEEYVGLPDHLSVKENLANLGYEILEDEYIDGDFDENAVAVRYPQFSYNEGEFDIAEWEE